METINNTPLDYKFNDGGRSKYFKADNVRDCVTRSIAIATGWDYKEIYKELKSMGANPRNGVKHSIIKKYMKLHKFEWHALMTIGSGCKHHLRANEIPMDKRIICNVSGHLTAVIYGVVNDTYDCTRDGNRCVYGYWAVTDETTPTPDNDKPKKDTKKRKTRKTRRTTKETKTPKATRTRKPRSTKAELEANVHVLIAQVKSVISSIRYDAKDYDTKWPLEHANRLEEIIKPFKK